MQKLPPVAGSHEQGDSGEYSVYALMMVRLSTATRRHSQHIVVTIPSVCLVGGMFSALLELLGVHEYPKRRPGGLAITALSTLLLVQAVGTWCVIKESSGGKKTALLPTLPWLFALGQLWCQVQDRSCVPIDVRKVAHDPTVRNE